MTPIERKSLKTDLLSRYNNQNEGGAFDAKKAGTSTSGPSLQAKQFDKTDSFLVKEPQGISQFKNDGNGLSQFVQGLDTRKYKG